MKSPRSTGAIKAQCAQLINIPNLVPVTIPPICVNGINVLAMEFETVDWLDVEFQQRIPLTINTGQVPSTQTDFPLLVNDTYPDLIGEAEAEIRFAGSDNVQLEYEIQKFDDSTGELIAWVKKPSVSDGDFLGIYFDNPGASDEQNPPAVYDANYTGVYHLHDEVSNEAIDSTINAQNMEIFTNTSAGFVPGKIGNAYNFPGNDILDYMIKNPLNIFPISVITLEYWIKTVGDNDGMISYATGSSANQILTFNQQNFRVVLGVNAAVSFSTAINNGVFRKIDVTANYTTGDVKFYLDGDLVGSENIPPSSTPITGGALVFGQDQDSVGGGFQSLQALDGDMEEIVLSDIIRDADYFKTRFNNQDDTSLFYTTGAVESLSSQPGEMEFETFGTMEFES